MNKHIISFGGNPIYICNNNRIANEEELKYLRKINTINHNKNNLTLSNGSQVFKNKKL